MPSPSTPDADDAPLDTQGPTLFLGPPPPFARPERGQAVADLAALEEALVEADGRATVVVTAAVPEAALAALGERFPHLTWWCAHAEPCADRFARHGLPRALAHAVRSPLGVLEGALEELRDRLQEDAPEWRMARRAVARLRRVATSLSDVATLAKPEATGEQNGSPAPLPELVRGAWREARQQLPLRREIELAVDSQALETHVPQAPTGLARALRELFINARQHGATHVRVQTALDESGAHLEVLDDGPGPGKARDADNWSPFVSAQLRGARTDLAFGLAIARADAKRCGGQLELTEGPEGQGTCARLTWPVQPA